MGLKGNPVKKLKYVVLVTNDNCLLYDAVSSSPPYRVKWLLVTNQFESSDKQLRYYPGIYGEWLRISMKNLRNSISELRFDHWISPIWKTAFYPTMISGEFMTESEE
jgi:hypothetical protein